MKYQDLFNIFEKLTKKLSNEDNIHKMFNDEVMFNDNKLSLLMHNFEVIVNICGTIKKQKDDYFVVYCQPISYKSDEIDEDGIHGHSLYSEIIYDFIENNIDNPKKIYKKLLKENDINYTSYFTRIYLCKNTTDDFILLKKEKKPK